MWPLEAGRLNVFNSVSWLRCLLDVWISNILTQGSNSWLKGGRNKPSYWNYRKNQERKTPSPQTYRTAETKSKSRSRTVDTAVCKLSSCHNRTEKENTYQVFPIHIPKSIRIKYDQSCEKGTPAFTTLPENENPPFLMKNTAVWLSSNSVCLLTTWGRQNKLTVCQWFALSCFTVTYSRDL